MDNLMLITGGVRSGKSMFAEQLAKQSDKPVCYIATMPVLDADEEQQQRIQRHRSRRPDSWKTVEAPYTLPQAVAELGSESRFCLIDCLSVYVSNIILGDTPDLGPDHPYKAETRLFSEVDRVIDEMKKQAQVQFVVVTNEVGWGVVPDNQLARAFRDFLGLVNQTFAQNAKEVWMTCVGIPTKIK